MYISTNRKVSWATRVHSVFRTIFFLTLLVLPAMAFSTTLKLGHVAGPNGAIGQGAYRFKENLERVSGGQMSVEVHLGGTLGGIRDLWAQMQIGVVDMQVIDLSAISLLKAAKPVQVVLLPYLFEDQNHYRRFAESDLLYSLLREVEQETNIKYLGIVEDRSPRIISTTTRPVSSLDDVSGLKIRVPPHPMFIDVFKNWGAVPTPIPPAEMFMSLKTGVVEAEDNGIVDLANGSRSEVIKHVSQIDWSRSGVAAWISSISWDKLNEQEQSWVREAAALSEQESKADFTRRMDEALLLLAEKNINIVDIDVEEFKTTSAKIESQYADTWPAELPERIRQLAE